jgi:diketogulonate reductase-like aldo/keto reductase
MTSGPVPRPSARGHRRAGPAGLDLAAGEHVLVIPGTGSPDHLDANVAAAALRLTREELARLQSLLF